eukprot:Seg2181.2 transcript_id=Seg2181.2/GoldUCD/mRNA.D3Y31 product="N-acetyl-beta-glucosaminyl-glycoprotein 4-beta-N-acetylgalactosaminyltransferase 1" protein_id=Seg2181.2/GoldUCD/D3Y31
MHYRFVKRFIVSAVLVILGGFLLISKWTQSGLKVHDIKLIQRDGWQTSYHNKVKRLFPADDTTIERDDDKHRVKYTSQEWITNVLTKNLTKDQEVDAILQEIDKYIPQNGLSTDAASSPPQVQSDFVQTAATPAGSKQQASASAPTFTPIPKKKRKKRKPADITFAGFMNVHIWEAWCGNTIEELRQNKHFPLYPDVRTTTVDLYVRHREQSYGQRIFGYVHPPKSGYFTFYISSDDNSELWVSNSSNPAHLKKIAWVGNSSYPENTPIAEFNRVPGQISKRIHLSRTEKYFIEVLHKQHAFTDHVLVAWKGPGIRRVKLLESKYLSAYMDEDDLDTDVNVLAEYVPETIASYPTHVHGSMEANYLLLKNLSKFGDHDLRDHFHLTPTIEESEIEGLLPKCKYEPSYVVDFKVNRYEGVYLIHETAVYPDDKTELTHMIPITDCQANRLTDSHRNLMRSTARPVYYNSNNGEDSDDTEEDSDVKASETGNAATDNNPGSVKISSNFSSLLTKLRLRFKDFKSYLKSNSRIFGKGAPSHSRTNGSRLGTRGELQLTKMNVASKKSRPSGKGEHHGSESNFQRSVKAGEVDKEDVRIISTKGRPSNKRNTSRGKITDDKKVKKLDGPTDNKITFDAKNRNYLSSLKSINQAGEESGKNKVNQKLDFHRNVNIDKHNLDAEFEMKLQAKDRSEGSKDIEDALSRDSLIKVRPAKDGGNIKSSDSKLKDSLQNSNSDRNIAVVSENLANLDETNSQSNYEADSRVAKVNEYETRVHQRKLLSYNEQTRKVFAYEMDDEGLPASWNKHNRSRPIFVPVQGVENENTSVAAFKKRGTSVTMLRAYHRQRRAEREAQPFEIKSYYKRFNITSSRDVIRYFNVYRFAFYDMIKDAPRLLSWKFHQDVSHCKSDGNLILNEKVATGIVNKYMRELKKRHGDKYTLKKIVNVEENHDVIKGNRYLIELDLKIKGRGEKSFRLSKYIYQKLGSVNLCEPEGFQWNPHTTVHVIVPVKDQGRWVQHFIDNMEKIYLETLDPHLNVIIVDFNSTDIDIEKSLRNSMLKRYQVIKLDGPFQRALGIQAGSDAVKDPHDIIFTCDLHLEIPSSLIYSIRKHCVEGKMAFAPIVVRLDCGYLPENPYGLWELQGYGLFAICKSDFDKAGGMNTKEFKTKWGGEDWEMLDRILSNKIEVERLRVPKFYHHYHSKKGMWLKE